MMAGRDLFQSSRPRTNGVFIVPFFHSTANPPVGLAYLLPQLAGHGINAEVRDLNIEGRDYLRRAQVPGVTEAERHAIVESLFLQSRRSYLGEALTWAWLDNEGRTGVAKRVLHHPNSLIPSFWRQVGIERLVIDGALGRCVDALRDWYDRQIAVIVARGIDWLGFSLTVSNQAAAFRAMSFARSHRPDLLIVAGGPHVSPRNARGLLQTSTDLDAVVVAPAYHALPALLTGGGTVTERPGIWIRRANEIVDPIGEPAMTAFDGLPCADWSRIPLDQYAPSFDVSAAWGQPCEDKRVVALQTSRGCSYGRCEFCHNVVDYPAFLARSPQRVAEDIRHQVESIGVRSVFFTDDEFNGSRGRVIEIARTIRRERLDIRFMAWLRLDKVDQELLEEMYEAGCRCVFVGVEAVEDGLLELLRKGYGAEAALRRLRVLHEFASHQSDFRFDFNLICGHPLESGSSAEATLRRLCAEPELFIGRVVLCRYHLYEGTPAFAAYRGGGIPCLDGVIPQGADVDSFRHLLADSPECAWETWRLVDQILWLGRRGTPNLGAVSMIYD